MASCARRDLPRAAARWGFFGYDLEKSPLGIGIHRLDGSPHRLYRRHEFARQLNETGYVDLQVVPALAGQLVRFHAPPPLNKDPTLAHSRRLHRFAGSRADVCLR